MFQLQRLNVVKLTDSEQKRDALLQKGFRLVKDDKKPKKAKTKRTGGVVNDRDREAEETTAAKAAFGATDRREG